MAVSDPIQYLRFPRFEPIPAAGPVARRLFEPIETAYAHPLLPWDTVPETLVAEVEVDPVGRQVAASLTAAVVEVLAGHRSPVQLERWLEPELVSLLEHLCRAKVGTGLRLRSIRVLSPSAGVLEVMAHLRQGTRSRAAALRLARHHGRWIATNLEISLRPPVINRAGGLLRPSA
jgi:hypothetical protein